MTYHAPIPPPEISEVARIRYSLKATQVELAQLLGVHPMTVSKWERGELEPSGYQLALLRDLRLDGDPWGAMTRARDWIRRFVAGELTVGAVLLELLQLARQNRLDQEARGQRTAAQRERKLERRHRP